MCIFLYYRTVQLSRHPLGYRSDHEDERQSGHVDCGVQRPAAADRAGKHPFNRGLPRSRRHFTSGGCRCVVLYAVNLLCVFLCPGIIPFCVFHQGLQPQNVETRYFLLHSGISDIIMKPGLVNVDFADVRTIMGNAGTFLLIFLLPKFYSPVIYFEARTVFTVLLVQFFLPYFCNL